MKHWLLFALLLNSPPALANSILQNVIDSTGTTVFLTREDIARLPAYGYREWASLQTSAVLKRGFLHLRGGRSDEIAVYIDGILQRHPFTGDPLTDIAPSLAEQVVITTGGFSAEYGHAMSGVIHITTPQNSQSLTGSIEGLTDHFSRPSFGHDALALALGSPIIPNRTTFFISGDWRDHADANPRHGVTAHETERDKLSSQTFTALADGRLPHNRLTTRTLRGHLNNRLTDRIHITAHLTDARSQRDYYIHTYRYNLPHAPTTLQQSRNAMLSLHYVHNPRTTFIARLGATTISDHQGDGTHQQDLSAYIRPTGNPNFDLTRLFYQGDADS
ncbi:MAG: TonB-dependent receptor plug domain-containing protein, partial [Candidatus Latescibacteria bacterium]|nr:TonB-dependent receptor plug domain-containing protein [Candidatus Latescibacterota bacterium]